MKQQWMLLKKSEHQDLWIKIYANFDFTSSKIDFISHIPFEVYDIKGTLWQFETYDSEGNYKTSEYIELLRSIFIDCMGDDDYMYALDWNHAGFKYDPRINQPHPIFEIATDENELESRAYYPLYYPDEDFHFFLANDLSWGYLGHPWQKKVYIFGEKMIENFDKYAYQLNFVKLKH